MEPVSYQIDGHDDIISVNSAWKAFARSNGAPHLAEQVVGRSLWEFVSDGTTRQVYRDLLVRVRGGRTVTFSYRCDSPSLRRYMRMTMTPGAQWRGLRQSDASNRASNATDVHGSRSRGVWRTPACVQLVQTSC